MKDSHNTMVKMLWDLASEVLMQDEDARRDANQSAVFLVGLASILFVLSVANPAHTQSVIGPLHLWVCGLFLSAIGLGLSYRLLAFCYGVMLVISARNSPVS